MWDYAALLPVADCANIVSLCEGGTPLVDVPRLAGWAGLGQVLIKNEMTNPTGSFKDRQISAGISHAKEIGARTVAVVSSGNVACAAAAYAARAGMNAVMFMHGHAASSKVAMASLFGGRVVQVNTPSASAVFDLCIAACKKFGWYHLSTAGMYNAYNVEGSKTIAYELYRQTGGDLPEWLVAPVGGGGLLGGIWRGFLDLQRLGLIEKPPRLAGVQAAGCAPLKQAIESGSSFLDTLKHPWPNPKTIAGGIADDILFDGHTVLPAIRTTGGAAIAVDDDATLDALRRMAALEGLLCEPTSAVAVAALSRLPDAGAKTRVCCVITGSGAKDFSAVQAQAPPPLRIGPSLDELDRALAG
jgi:threonine synthase